MAQPNYRPRPATATENTLRASNSQRSRITDSYRGVSNSPLDNELFETKITRRPQAIPIFDRIAEQEVKLASEKRKFFSPKQFQTIIANFDLSNLNGNYQDTTQSYEYETNDNKYYGNTFSKAGLEKVFRFDSGLLSMPRSAAFDTSRLFIQIDTTDLNMANYAFNYMFACTSDTALSTANRLVFTATQPQYQLNGYCPLNNIRLQIRDVAGPIILPEPRLLASILSVGLVTTLTSIAHGLVSGMRIYIDPKSNRKNVFPRLYTVTVIDPDTLEIPVPTVGLTYLETTNLPIIVDDYTFGYTIKVFSIREDEATGIQRIPDDRTDSR
jgi:hypothetical protein